MKIYLVKNLKGQYLRHEGHLHFWGPRCDAMEYSRADVAAGLARLYDGIVIEA
jgi:hypothetical protein